MPEHRSIAALSVFGRAGERADRNDSRVFLRPINSSTARIIMQLPKVIRSHLLSQSALQQQFCRGFDARRGVRGHHSVRKDTLLTPDELLQALAFHLVRAPRFRRSAFDVALAGSKGGPESRTSSAPRKGCRARRGLFSCGDAWPWGCGGVLREKIGPFLPTQMALRQIASRRRPP